MLRGQAFSQSWPRYTDHIRRVPPPEQKIRFGPELQKHVGPTDDLRNRQRHNLHRKPTPTQQARWEAVQQAREQGLSLRAIARKLGMDRNTVGKYALAETPPTKKLSAKERAKAEAQAGSPTSAD